MWAPAAAALGLRFVAHVTPPDMLAATADVAARRPFGEQFELQIFDDLAAAQDWLRRCRTTDGTAAATAALRHGSQD